MTMQRELVAAISAVCEASELCRKVQNEIDPGTLQKDDRSPVTVADFGSQALVCKVLEEHFPGDPIIAEEDSASLRRAGNENLLEKVAGHVGGSAGDTCSWIDRGGAASYSDRFWTLDPVDGTKGFLRGGQYAIALALVVEGSVSVAALACPNLPFGPGENSPVGTVFFAVKGHGGNMTALDDLTLSDPIKVSDNIDPAAARFCESVESGHSSHGDSAAIAGMIGISFPPVRLDSQAKYGVVGRGEADIYLRLPTRAGYVEKIWDHAAGYLVITEAGGRVSDTNGEPLDFSCGSRLEKNRGIIATNGLLHDQVLEAVKRQLG